MSRVLPLALCAMALSVDPRMLAQTPAATPRATLSDSFAVSLVGEVDSNSPALWERVSGRWTFFVLTSVAGSPSVTSGRSLTMLRTPNRIAFGNTQPAGVWMESVLRDIDSTWYGFYHQEQSVPSCNTRQKVVPRIGAARSTDHGRTWDDLGPILEAPPRTTVCETRNHYFQGGVGDFTALLDHDSQFLYLFYTQYIERTGGVGVSMARMAWAERDQPAGKMTVWNDGVWLAATSLPERDIEHRTGASWEYPAATPRFVAKDRWDNGNQSVDVLWGPAVHWNTYLNQYVMLLNRAANYEWKQQGIYISYNDRIDDPRGWSEPVELLDGGRWYPQVIGLDSVTGTDKEAGEMARFYMSGTSEYVVRFIR